MLGTFTDLGKADPGTFTTVQYKNETTQTVSRTTSAHT